MMLKKQHEVTVARGPSPLQGCIAQLESQGELQIESCASSLAAAWAGLTLLLFLLGLLGRAGVKLPYEMAALAKLLVLPALANAVASYYLSRREFPAEIRRRAAKLQRKLTQTIEQSQLLLALSDPYFVPGQGWQSEKEQLGGLRQVAQQGPSLTNRIMAFMNSPDSYSMLFDKPLRPGSEEAAAGDNNFFRYVLAALPLLPAVIFLSTSGIFSEGLGLFISTFLSFGLVVACESQISRVAFRSALGSAMASILKSQRKR